MLLCIIQVTSGSESNYNPDIAEIVSFFGKGKNKSINKSMDSNISGVSIFFNYNNQQTETTTSTVKT